MGALCDLSGSDWRDMMTQVGEGVAVPVPPPADPQDQHRIAIMLVPLPTTSIHWDTPWWPPGKRRYAHLFFSADTTDGHHEGALDGSGVVRFDRIPEGTCSISFPQFYDDIELTLKNLTVNP
jgi:hypothetical protein